MCIRDSYGTWTTQTISHVAAETAARLAKVNPGDLITVSYTHLDVYKRQTVARRNEKLVKLLNAIGDLALGTFADNTIDAFGDAYEYLMTMYAGSAGKSGGEFFTPQEVSELLARITVVGKTSVNKVYDPACGSGSLLLKFAKVLGKENGRQGFFGQEINLTTYNLARINMFPVSYTHLDVYKRQM